MRTGGLELKDHISLTSSKDVSAISSPVLDDIGVTYFNYIKIHHNDCSRELLTSNAEWIEHFYKNALYNSIGAIDVEHLLPRGYFLWSELNMKDNIYTQGRESFNIDNGISFVIKRPDVTYLYIFASTRDNYSINNFYTRNIDLFKRFILYFNDRGSGLIKAAAENRIFLPEKQIVNPSKVCRHTVTELDRQSFYDKTKVEKYYLLSYSDDYYLTNKQAECSAYLMAGASAKQCARAMGISNRTVEGYIVDIKNKVFDITGSRPNKEELIDFLKKTGMSGAVFPNDIELFSR